MVAQPIRIRAIFQDGKFVPQEPCALADEAIPADAPRFTRGELYQRG